MKTNKIFNFIFLLLIVGLCLVSVRECEAQGDRYQQTREEIIARTMVELQIKEYGDERQDKQPVLVLEKNIKKIPLQNTVVEIDSPRNENVYIGQKIREDVIAHTMSELQSKEDWSRDPPVFVAEQSFDDPRTPLKPRFEANWRYSNNRSIMMGEFWLPLVQCKEDAVLFCDLRIMGDDSENKEFNVGAGYREVLYDTILGNGVAGAMVWFDRRFTDRDFQFNQITLGGEWLGEQFDLRLNGYLPLDKKNTYTQANPNGEGRGFVGNQILVNTDQLVVEEVLPGLDFEAGKQLNFMNTITDSTRLFMGGYHFEGDLAEDITGVRTRIVSDITSDVQLGVRFQHDDVRGSQTYFESTIRFPFGHKRKYKREGYWSRLDESPERDIDVISNDAISDTGFNKTLLNASSGVTQNVIHVDNVAAAGGDGSVETPYNTLAAAEGVAAANDIIYVHVGDGTTTGQNVGITLDESGQMLIGSGVDLYYTSDRFQTSNGMTVSGKIIEATTAPKITNGAGNGVDIIADDVFVSGITVDGSNVHGIYALNSNNLVIDKVSALNNGTSIPLIHTGISIEANGKSLDSTIVTNSTIENSGNRGLDIVARNVGSIEQVIVTNNTVANNPVHGLNVQASGAGSVINKALISNNNVSGTASNNGLLLYAVNGGTINTADFINNISDNDRIGFHINSTLGNIGTVTLKGNVVNDSNLYGVVARSQTGGKFETLNLIDNTITNSTNYGVYVQATGVGSKITTTNITNNTSNNNVLHGFYASALSDGDLETVNFINNKAMNNASYGFLSYADGAGSAIATTHFTNNTASGSGSVGIYAAVRNDGDMTTVNFTKNTATDNANYGMRVEADDAGSIITTANFTDNIANNNTTGGLMVYAQTNSNIGAANFTNNTANNNTTYGYLVLSQLGSNIGQATLTGNTATSNTSYGYYAISTDAGSTIGRIDVNSNTATSNLDDGFHFLSLSDGNIAQVSLEDNISTSNIGHGFGLKDDSVAGSLTADLGGGAFGSTGGNSASGNTDQELLVDLDGGNLKAENNWWGSASGLTGAETLLEDASTVDAIPFLTTDPN